MERKSRLLSAPWLLASATIVFSICLLGVWSDAARAQTDEPIAYVGHGAFFDHDGNQIPLSLNFVEKAQAWYRQNMFSALNESQKRDFGLFEKGLLEGMPVHAQSYLVARQRALDWLVTNSPKYKSDDRLLAKLHALQLALTRPLPN